MKGESGFTFRPGRVGEGALLHDTAMHSVRAFCSTHYGTYFIETWMAGFDRDIYEPGIAAEKLIVAEDAGATVGFVEWASGRILRLYVT